MNRTALFRLAFVYTLCCHCCIYAQDIVDCVYPGLVSTSRVQGQVFDPLGVVVPDAAISLVDDRGSKLQTTTDNRGRFRLESSPVQYAFKALFLPFQTSQTILSVGKDLIGIAHPTFLFVILGLNGSDCPWATTSHRVFQQIINSNKKISKEATQQNAT